MLACRRCGAYAGNKVDDLRFPCPGPASGGKRYRINRIMSGLHPVPSRGLRLGRFWRPPAAILAWLDSKCARAQSAAPMSGGPSALWGTPAAKKSWLDKLGLTFEMLA